MDLKTTKGGSPTGSFAKGAGTLFKPQALLFLPGYLALGSLATHQAIPVHQFTKPAASSQGPGSGPA